MTGCDRRKDAYKMTFTVDGNNNGKVLRDFLRCECRISRAALVGLKKIPDGILLNGERVTVRAVVRTGDTVSVAIEDRPEEKNPFVLAGGELPQIVYEDEAVVLFNKPAGMPTHTSHGHLSDSLANAVCGYYESQGQPFVFRAVNRLDGDTSGIVMVAKNRYFSSLMSSFMAEGRFRKVYLAILDGMVDLAGEIEGYIKREGKSIIKRCLAKDNEENSEYSLTRYVRLSENNGKSTVLVYPVTGRTHQIRVHFASLGAPIYGDALYGVKRDDMPRQALHALRLSFPSYENDKYISVFAQIPSDIEQIAEKYGLTLPTEELFSERENLNGKS